jgi:hypothetical protein
MQDIKSTHLRLPLQIPAVVVVRASKNDAMHRPKVTGTLDIFGISMVMAV